MRTATILAALSFAATTFAQAVPEGIAPSESAPEGCEEDSKYNFTIGYAPLSSKKRESAVAADGSLILHLKDGVLKDSINRVGSIVANQQFQFDGPPQAGAIYTGGFSVCQNASLAIGGSTRWWKCGSGGFFNLYDTWIGDQCDEIRIVVSYQGVPSSTSSSSVASSTSQATTSTESASGSASGSGSSTPTPTLSATPLVSINGTVNSSIHSVFSSGSASATSATRTTGAPNAPAASTGGAIPTRVPRRESFGAVVGILGAAWLL